MTKQAVSDHDILIELTGFVRQHSERIEKHKLELLAEIAKLENIFIESLNKLSLTIEKESSRRSLQIKSVEEKCDAFDKENRPTLEWAARVRKRRIALQDKIITVTITTIALGVLGLIANKILGG